MRTLMIAIVLLLSWIAPGLPSAQARRTDSHRYRYEQVWTAAVRLIRVDYGFNIRDKDRDIGYLLFDYQDHGRTYPGSLELVRTRNEHVRVTLHVPSMPSYVERMLLDRLKRKLREELGQPLPPPRRAPPEPPDEDSQPQDQGTRTPRRRPNRASLAEPSGLRRNHRRKLHEQTGGPPC